MIGKQKRAARKLPIALEGIGQFCFLSSSVFAGLFELAGRAFVAFTLVGPYGISGTILASPVAWIMANLLLIPAYTYAIRQLQKGWDVDHSRAIAQ